MTLLLDAEAGGKVLFDRTFKGTLFRTWDEQPEAFKQEFLATARAVACATVIEPEEPDTYRGADPSNEGPLPHPMDPDIPDPEDPLAH